MKSQHRAVVIEPYWIQVIRYQNGRTVWNRYKVRRWSWYRVTGWMARANHDGSATLHFGPGRIVVHTDR